MGIIRNNPLLRGLSGRVGDFVFRQFPDKIVVAIRPRKRKKTVTASQLANLKQFRTPEITRQDADATSPVAKTKRARLGKPVTAPSLEKRRSISQRQSPSKEQ